MRKDPALKTSEVVDRVNARLQDRQTRQAGPFLSTFTGRRFHLTDPSPDEVSIVDIAHALSNLCRFAGHTSRFYSVAEHSVQVSLLVPPEHALAGLLHDAHEAYVIDLPRPLKALADRYCEVEQVAEEVVQQRFGLGPLPEAVRHIDHRILTDEARALMAGFDPSSWAISPTGAGARISGLKPKAAERAFLDRFFELGGQADG